MKNKQHPSGFTIVELLVVISIIALLVGILVPAVQKARDSAKVTQSRSNIHQVMIALANYASDHNDRNFSTAPDNLASGDRTGTDIEDAIEALEGPNPMGIELGEYEAANAAYVYYIGMFGNAGNETGGIAPYCFSSGFTMSSTGKTGYGVWRYPNAGQVAVYMNGQPLHSAYFAPKDEVPLRALERCDSISGTYCPTHAMADGHGQLNEWKVESNMLAIPSSYCISPAMMYSPAVYQWNAAAGKLPRDPMNLPRGFKPPSTDQARYAAHKTWLMEHNWLQNLDNNECGVNWEFGGWFLDGYGCYEECEPEHYNASRHSEPVAAFADGSIQTYSISDYAADSELAKEGQPAWDQQGLWLDLSEGSWEYDQQLRGYYVDFGTDWVDWSGHTHTKWGIRGRDKIAK